MGNALPRQTGKQNWGPQYALKRPVPMSWRELQRLAAVANVDRRTMQKVVRGETVLRDTFLAIANVLFENDLITKSDLPDEFEIGT
jgi:hypothetical protein